MGPQPSARAELQTCRDLAADIADGAPADEVRSRVGALQRRGPLWQLRMNCLRYCRFVHGHHGHEDVLLFPAVRSYAPGLNDVVDKLESDHRRVSDLLDTVEDAAQQLGGPDEGRPATVWSGRSKTCPNTSSSTWPSKKPPLVLSSPPGTAGRSSPDYRRSLLARKYHWATSNRRRPARSIGAVCHADFLLPAQRRIIVSRPGPRSLPAPGLYR